MHTSTSLVGFLASRPQLVVRSNGERKVHVKIGQSIYHPDHNGHPRLTDTTFGDMVLYGRTAQEAFDRFAQGDTFIAEGEMRTRVRSDGTTTRHFHARRIGHDTGTSYTVERAEPPTRARGRPAGRLAPPEPDPPGTTSIRTAQRRDSHPDLGL